MRSILLRRSGLPSLLLLLLLALAARPAAATHLLGGEVRYRYLGISTTVGRPFRYEITFSIYVNCDSLGQFGDQSNVPYGRAGIGVRIFDKTNGAQILDPDNPSGTTIPGRTGMSMGNDDDQFVPAGRFPFARTDNPVITPPPPVGCNITAGCARLVTYTRTVDLPVSVGGYYAVYSDNARNNSVTNIQNAFMTSQLLYVYMPPGALLPNHSPVFTDTAVVLVCAGTDTVTLINNAFDDNGDRLTYEFYAPYGGPNPFPATFTTPTPVTYASGFTFSQPFGAGGYAFINANTGLTRYFVPNEGDYVVGVLAREHRIINGRDSVISFTLREIQLKVRQCANLPAPTLQFTGGQTSISIEEGATATFTATANVSAGNPIRLSATSPLLDGPGGFNATFNNQQGTAANQPIVINGTTTLTGTFRFVSTCGSAGIYNVNLAARDQQGCPIKTTSIPYVITVRKPAAPTSISGASTACPNTTATYTAVGAPTGTTGYVWHVAGGTIQGSSTGASITVLWTTSGTDTVSVKALSALGCPSDALVRTVEVSQGTTVLFSGLQPAYCLNPAAAGITLAGTPTGGTYTITPASGAANLVNGVFKPLVAGTFQITYTATGSTGCVATSAPFTVVVNPLPTVVLAASLATTYCSNDAAVTLAGTVNGTAATTGFTIDGVTATVFDPATLSPGPHTVVLTGTGVGNCQNTATRVVTVNAAPVVALTGLQPTYCKNAATVTLTATANGQPLPAASAAFTIDGTAATQLNPANLAVGFHIVRVVGTATNGCRSRDSLQVEIKALPVLAITGLNSAYCKDAAPITLAGTIDGATGGGAFTIDGVAATIFNPQTLAVGPHTVVFNGVGTNGCANSLSQTVTVNPLPVVAIVAPSATTFCLNDPPVTLQGNAPGQFFIDGSATPATVFDPSVVGVGTHTIRFTRTETSTGCSNAITLTVTVNPLPVLAITGLQAAYCKDAAPVTLTGTVNGTAGGSFTIDGTAATILNPQTLAAGPHTIIFSGTGVNGCSDKDTTIVQINALPVVAFTGLATAYCVDAPAVTLAATLDGATNLGGVTFTIDGQPATVLTPSALTPGPHTVVATGTLTATGCVNTATQTVTINALPTVAITNLQSAYCQDAAAVTLTATVNGATTGGTVTFTINGTPATSFNPATLGPGSYTVIATGTLTATGCVNTTTQTVVVNALPTVAITGLNPAYCTSEPAVTLAATVNGSTSLGTVTFTINGQPATVLDPGALTAGTYTVVATGTLTATGCVNTTTQTVAINALPTVAFTGLNAAYCADATAVTLGATVNGSTTTGTVTFTIDGTAATTLDPAALAAGPHTVVATGTLTATGCVNTTTQTVTINALPTVAITNLQSAYCVSAAAVTLTGTVNGAAGTVAFTINGTPATSFNPATLGPGTYTVVATGTDGNTCQNTATQTVTINALPTVAFAGLDPAYCRSAGVVTLSATVNGAAGTVTFTVDGQPATTLDPATLPLGPHTVVATGTDGNTCQNTATQTVTINALPTVAITGLQSAYCASVAALPLTATVNGAAGNVTFTIDGTAATTLDPTTLTPGTHTVVATGTDGNTCQNTATQTVTINALPVVTATASQNAICQGESVTLTAGGATTYTWSDGTNTFTGPSLTQSPTATTTYTLTGIDGNTCQNTATLTITVNPKPTADTFTGPNSVCPGLTGVPYNVTNPAFQNYRWFVRGGTINGSSTGSTVTVDWGPTSATARVQLVSLDNTTGCPSDTITLPVTINQVLQTQTPTGQASVCINAGTQTFQIPVPSPGSTYQWGLTGTAGASIASGQGTATITVNFAQPGTTTLVVTESSTTTLANCFGQSPPFNVTVLPAPSATLAVQGPATACADGSAQSFTLAGDATSTYAWTVNGQPQAATGTTFTYNATTAGTFTIGAQETNTVGCSGPTFTTQLLVNSVPGAVSVAGPTTLCSDNLTGLTFSVNAQPPGSTYQWNVTGGTITSGQGTSTVTVTFDGVNVPTLTVAETSSAGCTGQATPLPLTLDLSGVGLKLATVAVLTPTQITLDLQVSNPPANASQVLVLRRDLTGAFNQVGSLPASATSFTDGSADPNATAYVYRLDYTNACGTVLRSDEHTTMHLDATAEETSGNVRLTWNAYQGQLIRKYEVLRVIDAAAGTFEVMATITDPNQTSYLATGIGRDAFDQTFRIRAELGGGASVVYTSYSNESKVHFENKLQTYNIITPNGDGLNDQLIIENVALYPSNELAVFNRWGREVFRKSNYDNSWTGGDLAAGTYYYQFTAGGQTLKGWFEIVR